MYILTEGFLKNIDFLFRGKIVWSFCLAGGDVIERVIETTCMYIRMFIIVTVFGNGINIRYFTVDTSQIKVDPHN